MPRARHGLSWDSYFLYAPEMYVDLERFRFMGSIPDGGEINIEGLPQKLRTNQFGDRVYEISTRFSPLMRGKLNQPM